MIFNSARQIWISPATGPPVWETAMADDLYDFTGVSFDLELLRSELKSLQAATDRHIGYFNRKIVQEEDQGIIL